MKSIRQLFHLALLEKTTFPSHSLLGIYRKFLALLARQDLAASSGSKILIAWRNFTSEVSSLATKQ